MQIPPRIKNSKLDGHIYTQRIYIFLWVKHTIRQWVSNPAFCCMGSGGLWPMLSGMSSSEAKTCQLIAVLLCGTKLNLRHGERHGSLNFCFQENNSTYDWPFAWGLGCRAGLRSPRETGSLLPSRFISLSAKTMKIISSQSKNNFIQHSLISSI